MTGTDAASPEAKSLDIFSQLQASARTSGLIILALVLLGVLARANRYLQAWDPWGDETALVINIVERDYAGLLAPLDYNQVAPVGYLWLAKTTTLVFGVNELSLRLPAFLFSILALVAVVHLARACTVGWEVLVAVGIFAVSNYHIRHAAEMKQYAVECGVAAALLSLGISAAQGRLAAAWGLALAAPLAVFTSLTSTFVAGGIGLALLPSVLARRSWRWWAWYLTYGAVVAGSFLVLYLWVLKPQLDAHLGVMIDCWSDGMPRWNSPTALLGWCWRTATGSVFAHPAGGANGESLPFALLFWIGVVALWRRGDRLCLRLLGGVFGLALLAACLGKFPLGGHPRIVLYLSPLVVLPMGVGAASLIRWRTQEAAVMRTRGVLALALLVVIGLAGMVKDLAKPYFDSSSKNLGQFARWFWQDYQAASPGPLASVAQDGSLVPWPPREHAYLHARHSRHALRLPAVPGTIDGPTGLVICTVKQDNAPSPVTAWRAALARRYDVFDHQSFQVNLGPRDCPVCYDILWIRPASSARVPAQPVSRVKDGTTP
jgi:hypothetical protein